jgi:hypothetical protein
MISLSWNSAGSGFESLAAHISPGHASVQGFLMSGTHHLPTTLLDVPAELIASPSGAALT